MSVWRVAKCLPSLRCNGVGCHSSVHSCLHSRVRRTCVRKLRQPPVAVRHTRSGQFIGACMESKKRNHKPSQRWQLGPTMVSLEPSWLAVSAVSDAAACSRSCATAKAALLQHAARATVATGWQEDPAHMPGSSCSSSPVAPCKVTVTRGSDSCLSCIERSLLSWSTLESRFTTVCNARANTCAAFLLQPMLATMKRLGAQLMIVQLPACRAQCDSH